jgi:hypothetical protein
METVATSYHHRPCSSPTVWRRQLLFIARDEIDDLHRRVDHLPMWLIPSSSKTWSIGRRHHLPLVPSMGRHVRQQ